MILNRIPRSFSDSILQANLEAHYKCNDDAASTTVTNEKGTNGTASTNTSNLSVTGKINNAFDFTLANSEYVDCNQTFQSIFRNDFSVAAWIKPDDGQPAAIQDIYRVRDATNTNQVGLVLLTDGKILALYEANNVSAAARSNAAVFANGVTAWTHVVVTCDDSNLKIYFDGSEVTLEVADDGDMSGVTKSSYTNIYNLYFGAFNDAGTPAAFVDGVMDDVRIYSEVIAQSKIDLIYNSGNGTES